MKALVSMLLLPASLLGQTPASPPQRGTDSVPVSVKLLNTGKSRDEARQDDYVTGPSGHSNARPNNGIGDGDGRHPKDGANSTTRLCRDQSHGARRATNGGRS